MKKPPRKQDTKTEKQPAPPTWPREARVGIGRQPRNTRLLTVQVDGEPLLVRVRDNRFYRANEKLTVDEQSAGVYVDIRPKTSPLLRGGQE